MSHTVRFCADLYFKMIGIIFSFLIVRLLLFFTRTFLVPLGLESMRTNNETPQSENIKETIDCLESACAFMSSSINRCIDYSKTSVGISLTPSKSSFNLLSSLSNPVKWMRSSLPKDGRLNIILNPIPDNIDKIISDQHWIEENLLCLLSNAIKYSLRGNIRISITLEGSNSGNDKTDNNNCNHRINDISHNDGSILHRTDKQDIDNCEIKTDAKHKCNGCGNSSKIRISVEDDGIGISSVSKSLLFKQFSKLQSNAIGSTGLGLYSLSQRSEAIGGSCGVHDKENGLPGSVFWYEFPYIASIDIKPRKDLSLQYNNDIKEKKLTILIVDDSVTVIKCLNNTLRSHGHNVISAYNGADGLDQMKEHYNDLDIVIMDLQMPIMDGIEATKRFREYENIQNIRFDDDDNDNHHDNRDTQQNYYDVNSTDSFRYGQCDSDNNRNFNNHGHDDNHENNGDHDNENFNVNDNTEIADSDNNTEKKNKRIDRHKIKKRKRLPIICSSANSDREVEFLARSAGMDSFLPKPFHISDLTCILSSFEYAR